MTKQNFNYQDVMTQNEFYEGDGYPSCDGEPCVNMADDEQDATATMAEGEGPVKDAEGEADEAGLAMEREQELQTEEHDESQLSATDDAAEWRDKYVRLQAEFDNYRKRTLREKMDLVASGGADVLKCMLSVLDDVHRAVAASDKSDDIAALREGERLVAQKFEEALRQKGVCEIEACGKEFDPDFHEAVARFAAGDEKRGLVIDVVQRGYMLGEKVLRYAKVVVGE